MSGHSTKNRENYLRECLNYSQVTANWCWNNWALDEQRQSGVKFLDRGLNEASTAQEKTMHGSSRKVPIDTKGRVI